jgi:hypothetical protein
MSRRGFTAVFSRCDADVGRDGMAALFNVATDKTRSVHICEIRTMARAINPDATNPLGNQGIMSLDRISAVSGGEELAPIKHDTDAADLPAQVKLYENPDSVTGTGTIRRFGDCISSYTITKAISFQAMMRAPGICDTNDHSGRTCEGHNVWHADGDSDTEPIVLNPGEGFCLTRLEFGLPQAFHLGATVRVVGTNRTYRWSDSDVGSSLEKGMAAIALINGIGSGVVLQVMVVSLPDLGEENIPSYRVIRCAAGMDAETSGKPVTVVAHDTANSVTDIEAYRGSMKVLPAAAANGLQIDYLNYQNTPIPTVMQQRADCFRRWLGAGPYVSETGTVTMAADMLSRSEFEIWPGDRRGAGGNSDTELILWPGQGVAVVGGGAGLIETSEQAYLDIEISGYIDVPDTSGVYPAANDVRDGVDYGPTGVEFDGDLVLPVEADVKLGTGYGADGTEFTGTYAAGGGWSGISRGRAVNAGG